MALDDDMANEFGPIISAVRSSLGDLGDLDPVWSAQRGERALLVLRRPSDDSELAALCTRSPTGWDLVGVENLWFVPYDGSAKPFSRDGHNPVGVAVHGVTMQPGVTACRVGDPNHPVEQAVIDGRWYRCVWDVRPWGSGWPWPPVGALLLDGRWEKPVSAKRPMTREFLVALVVQPEKREGACHLLDALIEEDAALAWSVMVEIADALPDEEGLGYLGAGPLENWFRVAGDRYFDAIDREARRSRKMALALHGVWAYDAPARDRLDMLLTELGLPPGPLA